MDDDLFHFSGEIWRNPGKVAYFFVSLPEHVNEQMVTRYAKHKLAWGMMPVTVTIGRSTWNTILYQVKGREEFILSINAKMRKKEQVDLGSVVDVSLRVRVS